MWPSYWSELLSVAQCITVQHNISYSSCDMFMFSLRLLRKDYHSSDSNYLQFLFARWEIKLIPVIWVCGMCLLYHHHHHHSEFIQYSCCTSDFSVYSLPWCSWSFLFNLLYIVSCIHRPYFKTNGKPRGLWRSSNMNLQGRLCRAGVSNLWLTRLLCSMWPKL